MRSPLRGPTRATTVLDLSVRGRKRLSSGVPPLLLTGTVLCVLGVATLVLIPLLIEKYGVPAAVSTGLVGVLVMAVLVATGTCSLRWYDTPGVPGTRAALTDPTVVASLAGHAALFGGFAALGHRVMASAIRSVGTGGLDAWGATLVVFVAVPPVWRVATATVTVRILRDDLPLHRAVAAHLRWLVTAPGEAATVLLAGARYWWVPGFVLLGGWITIGLLGVFWFLGITLLLAVLLLPISVVAFCVAAAVPLIHDRGVRVAWSLERGDA